MKTRSRLSYDRAKWQSQALTTWVKIRDERHKVSLVVMSFERIKNTENTILDATVFLKFPSGNREYIKTCCLGGPLHTHTLQLDYRLLCCWSLLIPWCIAWNARAQTNNSPLSQDLPHPNICTISLGDRDWRCCRPGWRAEGKSRLPW